MTKTRIIRLLICCLFLFLLLKGCSYLDSKVSEKYETQLEGITKSPDRLQKAKEKHIELQERNKRIAIESIIAVLLIVILFSIDSRIKEGSREMESRNE